MNMLNVTDVKWVKDNVEDVKQLTAKVSEAVKNAPLPEAEYNMVLAVVPEADEAKPAGALAKMKAFVRKAVDCCIE